MALSAYIETITAPNVGKIIYDITFEGPGKGYLEKTHIYLWINDVQIDIAGGGGPDGFTWITESQVQLKTYVPVLNDKIEFRRTMPVDDVYRNFTDGGGFTERLLDEQNLANLFIAHEILDGFGTGTQSYYALAKLYANADEDYEVEPGQYSAKHFSIKAGDSATAASTSASNAAASEAAAWASEQATAADALATAADAVATAADRVVTTQDAIDTAADAVATAADRVQTDIDQQAASSSASAASSSASAAATSASDASDDQILAAASQAAAAVSETNALASEEKAEDWAIQPEDVEVETGKYSALHWAAKAEAAAASGLYKESEHTATAGQTLFTHTADVTNEQISLNGAILGSADYTVSSTTQITLAAGAIAGDLIRIQTIGLIAVNEYVPLSGNASEPMTGELRLSGFPTDDDDATSKEYVDAHAHGNLFINGSFQVWQRGNGPFTAGGYTADRWVIGLSGPTVSVTPYTFTLGQTDVPGNPKNGISTNITASVGASDICNLQQRHEDVRRCGGSTVTVSFWAKMASGTANVSIEWLQNFGTGGSAEVSTVDTQALAVTSTWQQFKRTITLPTVGGKAIGAGSYTLMRIWMSAGSTYSALANSIGNQTGNFQMADIKMEYGTDATPFIRPFKADEVLRCMRYYEIVWGIATSTASAGVLHATNYLVEKRANPTLGTPTFVAGTGAAFQTYGNQTLYQNAGHSVYSGFYIPVDAEL